MLGAPTGIPPGPAGWIDRGPHPGGGGAAAAAPAAEEGMGGRRPFAEAGIAGTGGTAGTDPYRDGIGDPGIGDGGGPRFITTGEDTLRA